MATVGVDDGGLLADSQPESVDLVSSYLAFSLHSSAKPSKLSHWPYYEDS